MVDKTVQLKVCLDALGIQISMDDFDSRLVLQKATYLLQAHGVDLGYGFGWYIRGPYSSYLADIGFRVDRERDEVVAASQRVSLKDWASEKINDCRALIHADKPDTSSLVEWLELLASTHYLRHRTFQGKQIQTREGLVRLVKNHKGWFNESEIAEAVQILERRGLVSFD